MSIIEKLEQEGHQALTALEHAAVWLVGTVATAETGLHKLEADNPLLATAIQMGIASATAHGVPLTGLEALGNAVLDLAKDLAAGLAQPAPAAPAPAA